LEATGLIANLARPGGNVTGVSAETAELAAKNLELIGEILPGRAAQQCDEIAP
jgi:putative ABC transport system substrate-binding protein